MTVRDLIRASMRKLGVISAGEQPSAQEAADGLEALNALLESWNTERLFVFSIVPRQYNLVAGKQTYTIGPGGEFDGPRPVKIDQAYVIFTPNGDQPPTIPIEILTLDQWASKEVKNTPSTFPTQMYNDSDNPLSNLSFWPIPTLVVPVVLWCWGQISAFPDINADISLPPGYYRALVYNLAVELAPEFGRSVTPEIAAIATEAKGDVKITNSPDLMMTCDDALVNNGRAGWSYITGDWKS